MEYKAVFDIKGLEDAILTGQVQRKIIESIYVLCYNRFCELVNPMYETWNKEFDELYPDLDGESDEYNAFIRGKQNEVIKNDTLLNNHKYDWRCYSGEECDFRMSNGKVHVSMHLEPM